MDWQTVISLVIVALAAVWCCRMLYVSVQSALKPSEKSGCASGCGCHAPKLGSCDAKADDAT
ncbi:MAG TPA: hypothetical protein VEJ63_11735 [Planctomycetota bacterium]|nr:hypothetical protein [Planctomycetota bacterium]